MNASLEETAYAMHVAVHLYKRVAALEDPCNAAAFGVSCGVLMNALNVNLEVAARLLGSELDKQQVGRAVR